MRSLYIILVIAIHTFSQIPKITFKWSEPNAANSKSYSNKSIIANVAGFELFEKNEFKNLNIKLYNLKTLVSQGTITFDKKAYDMEVDYIFLSENNLFVIGHEKKGKEYQYFFNKYDMMGKLLTEKKAFFTYTGKMDYSYYSYDEETTYMHVSIASLDVFFNLDFKEIKRIDAEKNPAKDKDDDDIRTFLYSVYNAPTKSYYKLFRVSEKKNDKKGTYQVVEYESPGKKALKKMNLPMIYNQIGFILNFKIKDNLLYLSAFYDNSEDSKGSYDGVFSLEYDLNEQKAKNFKEKPFNEEKLSQIPISRRALIKGDNKWRLSNILTHNDGTKEVILEDYEKLGRFSFGNIAIITIKDDIHIANVDYIAKYQLYNVQPQSGFAKVKVYEEMPIAAGAYSFLYNNKILFLYHDDENNEQTNQVSEIQKIKLQFPKNYGLMAASYDGKTITKKFLYKNEDMDVVLYLDDIKLSSLFSMDPNNTPTYFEGYGIKDNALRYGVMSIE